MSPHARRLLSGREVGAMNRHERRRIAAANKQPVLGGTNKPHVNPKKST